TQVHFLGLAAFAIQSLLATTEAASSPGLTHQVPEHAPARPVLDTLPLYTTSQIGGRGLTHTPSLLGNLFGKRQREEDGNGGLLCKNAPCVDDSCCGPAGVCGYGPDFCGDGCTSNCDAVAMCGNYSEGGDTKCGMNLCCSWGGWCGTSDVHCIGPNKFTPCQEDFGSCEIIRPTLCGEDSMTTLGRTVGYYLASNTRDRLCNRIEPKHINAQDYTHLFFSFASIDPDTFQIRPWDEADVPLMEAFTALETETWIAVGGYSFSDPGPTQTTWSDMCSTAENRAAFIRSTAEFMDRYGFTGVDLDWEYPVSEERGGSKADTDNFAKLLREMRVAYGTRYGISLTLAPDYWYLRYFDAKAMEPYVDFFGFMAYDLHGFWDSDVEALGSLVRGQADVREIYNGKQAWGNVLLFIAGNTLPLWYAGLDPAKINFGLAWYGRGYTLQDPSCDQLECPFAGPNAPAECTNAEGVMSLTEIKQLIRQRNLTPRLNAESMMKELVWDGQWLGYDDEETHALKRRFANNLCFGGTMAWSVDFNSGAGDSDHAPVSTDGRCGPDHGGVRCEGSAFGDCCSVAGYCGSTEAHCGSGCLSGKCLQGGETTDGTCGAAHHDSFCGLWEQGSCCSSSGYCGNSEAHCGTGCQSGGCLEAPDHGGGSGPIYIAPEVYDDENPTASCFPPCTFIMPPWVLDGPTTISQPPATVSYLDTWDTTTDIGGGTIVTTAMTETTSTIITLPPVTTTEIEVWNVIWVDDEDDDDDDEIIVGLTSKDDDGPNPPPPPPPPPGRPSSVTGRRGPPKPTCKPGQHCGKPCRSNCGGGGGGGGGGCKGVCGCIGPRCPGNNDDNNNNNNCVGSGCPGGGGGNGENGEDECTTRTVTDIWVSCDPETTTSCTIPRTTQICKKYTTRCPKVSAGRREPQSSQEPPPRHGVTTSPWNKGGGGGGGTPPPITTPPPSGPTSLPPLPSSSAQPPYSGSGCQSYAHTTRCNGSGGRSACVTQDLCVPTAPCPSSFTASGTPVCTGEYSICVITTIVTRCARVGDATAAAVNMLGARPTVTPTASVVGLPSSSPTPASSTPDIQAQDDAEPTTEPGIPAVRRADDEESHARGLDLAAMPVNASELQSVSPSALLPRQNGCGGSANGGCDYIRFCAPGGCAKIENVPCLEAHIYAHTGALSGTEVSAWVIEDGDEKCRGSITCDIWDSDCSGTGYFDCGGGNQMGWNWNYIEYYSSKYESWFPLYLDRTGGDEIVFCSK
ncbi:glycoside hydrolase superfamily, partial [Apiospora hydei]